MDRGENHLASGHLRSFHFADADDITTYRAAVQSSLQSILRKVEMTIRKQNNKIEAECDCPVGSTRCSHMAAVLLHIHRNVSCTDTLATWSQAGPIEYETQTIEEMIGVSDSLSVDFSHKLQIQNTIRNYVSENRLALPAAWLLKQEPDETEEEEKREENKKDLHNLGKIVLNPKFKLCDNKKESLERFCAVTNEEIQQISEKTIGQWQNPEYLKFKPLRLTASNFGYILQAVSRNSYPPSLFGRLLNTSDLSRVKSIQWGVQNESHALRILKEKYNVEEIRSTGLHLHPCGVLGASPDGISDFSVTEIKCPYKFRKSDLQEALIYKVNKPRAKKNVVATKRKRAATKVAPVKIRKNTYILYILDGKLQLNKDHPYYSQIQAQMYFCKKEWTNLFIWTTKSHLLVRVRKDPLWERNIDILKDFYYDRFIPYVLTNVK